MMTKGLRDENLLLHADELHSRTPVIISSYASLEATVKSLPAQLVWVQKCSLVKLLRNIISLSISRPLRARNMGHSRSGRYCGSRGIPWTVICIPRMNIHRHKGQYRQEGRAGCVISGVLPTSPK